MRLLRAYYYTEDSVSFPTIETHRLKLTSFSEDDSTALLSLFSDPDVVKYYDLDVLTQDAEALKLIALFNARFHSGEGIRWAIRLKETEQLIGTCGFNSWSAKMRSAVIGYDLQSKFWGLGLATEAITEIINAAFTHKLQCSDINRIQADTVLGNSASESLLRRIGFKEEGIRRQSGYWKGQFHDLKCFGLLRSEFSSTRQEA